MNIDRPCRRLLFLTLLATFFLASRASAETRTVRWIVAHARDDQSFKGLLDAFAGRVAERSQGRLKVEFIDVKADSQRTDADADKIAFSKLTDGSADMSQIAAGRMGVRVIDEPFLFRSYEHAEAVWRGPLGKTLLDEVASENQDRVRGLAFAYSGGFRVFVGQAAVRKLSDFKGLRMEDTGGEPAALLRALGVKLVSLSPAQYAAVKAPLTLPVTGSVDLAETEINGLAYVRAKFPETAKKLKYVDVTRHSMLVTAMAVNDKFFRSLSPDDRRLLTEEVQSLSLAERKLSVSLAQRNLKLFARSGLEIVTLPAEEQLKFAKVGEAIQEKSGQLALIQQIQAVGEIPLQASR